MTKEPVLAAGSLAALVATVLVLLRAFGIAITEDQYNAILGVVAVGAPIAAALWARRKVTPVQ